MNNYSINNILVGMLIIGLVFWGISIVISQNFQMNEEHQLNSNTVINLWYLTTIKPNQLARTQKIEKQLKKQGYQVKILFHFIDLEFKSSLKIGDLLNKKKALLIQKQLKKQFKIDTIIQSVAFSKYQL